MAKNTPPTVLPADEEKWYMHIEFNYSYQMILPYTDGLKIIELMEKAELCQLDSYTDNSPLIFKTNSSSQCLQITKIPKDKYIKHKMETLLAPKDTDKIKET